MVTDWFYDSKILRLRGEGVRVKVADLRLWDFVGALESNSVGGLGVKIVEKA